MLESLVISYGYVMIALGTFLEGETVLLIGGYLAHMGYLQLPWVIVTAFVGSVAGDQLFYYIGRKRGMALLEQRPQWRAKSEKVLSMLHRHRYGVILSFRFLYGLRTVTPFLIGASGVRPQTFSLLNAAGAAVWAATVALLGYLLGHAVSLLLAEAHRYEGYGIAAIVLIAMLLWGGRRIKKRSARDGEGGQA